MTNATIAAAYLATRARLLAGGYTVPAAVALKRAKADLERAGYAAGAACPKLGARTDRGGRWAERPEAVGARFVGFADDVAGRGVTHRGWYTDPNGDGDVARGAVYQLPGRGGEALFVAGLHVGSGDKDWTDSGTRGSAMLFLDTIYRERADDSYVTDYQSARSAAYAADREAELYADDEREYQEAWQAGAFYADKLQIAAVERQKARALMREAKKARIAAGGAFPAVCDAIRVAIRNSLIAARRERQQAAELRDRFTYGRELVPAFADGMGDVL